MKKPVRMATPDYPNPVSSDNVQAGNLKSQGHTIVGGRPAGKSSHGGSIPRGMEILLKRAAIDEEFRQRLLEERSGVAHLQLRTDRDWVLDVARFVQARRAMAGVR